MARVVASIRRSARYYATAVAFVSVLGLLAAIWTYRTVSTGVQDTLLADASAIAYAIDTRQLTALAGDDTDLENPEYLELKERLMRVRATNEDIRFVYITGYRDGEPFFYVDSEPDDSEDYSPPGQVYEEGSEPFRTPFETDDPSPIMEGISSDRWGTWLTALTPMVDASTGEVIALMGMDMNADQYYRTMYLYSLIPVAIAAFVVLLLTIGYLIRRREQKLLDFKAELVSIASHELRTPLTGMSWIAENLLKHPESLTEKQLADIRTIESESRELLLTVNDFLDLATLENTSGALTPTKVPLLPLVNELAESFKASLAEKSLTFNIDPSFTPTLSVSGNADRLKRMLANLLSNAIKYSKQNGTVAVAAEARDDHVTIAVKDEGIGIPAKDVSKIFGGYYRSQNAREHTEHGTGLGLRYVQQIVELHHGRAWVESQVDHGSTFFVELPT